jgi:hypothetical protein
MTPMVSTLSRWLRGCALFMATVLLAGCTRVVVGTGQPLGASGDETPPVALADLLIDPGRFPAQYPAAVLDQTAVFRAQQDIDGVLVGSVVTPRDCAPPAPGHGDAAAAEGIDSVTASSLIVVVTRPAPPIRSRVDQLRACTAFATGRGEDTSTVTVTLLPAPPVDADDSYASDQTVKTPNSVRRTLTLAAQIGDTRVSATWLQDPSVGDPETTALDTLFSDAVLKVHRGG